MVESSHTVNFCWKLENFPFCDFYCNTQLNSPDFIVRPCEWSLYMFPNGHGVDKYVGIYLKRSEEDHGPNEISVRFKISLLDADGHLCPDTPSVEKVFSKGCEWGHNEFILRSELSSDSLFLYQDTLTILCDIAVIGPVLSDTVPRRQLNIQPEENEDIRKVYKAINSIYEDNLYYDVILKSKNKTFNVHKCILRVRLPELYKKLERTQEVVLDDEFFAKKFLSYAYTGRLDIKNGSVFNIEEPLAEYGLLQLQKDLLSKNNSYQALTYFNVKKLWYSWEVLTSLLNREGEIISPFISDGFRETGFLVCLNRNENGVWCIKIKTSKSNNDDLFVRCSISIKDPTLPTRSSVVYENLYKTDVWWQCPGTLQLENSSLIFNNIAYSFRSSTFYLDFIFTYPTGRLQSSVEHVLSTHTTLTGCNVDHRENLLLDLEKLYNNQYDSDAIIIVGNRRFRVHKCILCARSPFFRAMFLHDMAEREKNGAELKHNVLDDQTFAEVVDKLLLFTYCGKFEAKSATFARYLLDSIQMYMIGEEYEEA